MLFFKENKLSSYDSEKLYFSDVLKKNAQNLFKFNIFKIQINVNLLLVLLINNFKKKV